jgi:hypothetical protein
VNAPESKALLVIYQQIKFSSDSLVPLLRDLIGLLYVISREYGVCADHIVHTLGDKLRASEQAMQQVVTVLDDMMDEREYWASETASLAKVVKVMCQQQLEEGEGLAKGRNKSPSGGGGGGGDRLRRRRRLRKVAENGDGDTTTGNNNNYDEDKGEQQWGEWEYEYDSGEDEDEDEAEEAAAAESAPENGHSEESKKGGDLDAAKRLTERTQGVVAAFMASADEMAERVKKRRVLEEQAERDLKDARLKQAREDFLAAGRSKSMVRHRGADGVGGMSGGKSKKPKLDARQRRQQAQAERKREQTLHAKQLLYNTDRGDEHDREDAAMAVVMLEDQIRILEAQLEIARFNTLTREQQEAQIAEKARKMQEMQDRVHRTRAMASLKFRVVATLRSFVHRWRKKRAVNRGAAHRILVWWRYYQFLQRVRFRVRTRLTAEHIALTIFQKVIRPRRRLIAAACHVQRFFRGMRYKWLVRTMFKHIVRASLDKSTAAVRDRLEPLLAQVHYLESHVLDHAPAGQYAQTARELRALRDAADADGGAGSSASQESLLARHGPSHLKTRAPPEQDDKDEDGKAKTKKLRRAVERVWTDAAALRSRLLLVSSRTTALQIAERSAVRMQYLNARLGLGRDMEGDDDADGGSVNDLDSDMLLFTDSSSGSIPVAPWVARARDKYHNAATTLANKYPATATTGAGAHDINMIGGDDGEDDATVAAGGVRFRHMVARGAGLTKEELVARLLRLARKADAHESSHRQKKRLEADKERLREVVVAHFAARKKEKEDEQHQQQRPSSPARVQGGQDGEREEGGNGEQQMALSLAVQLLAGDLMLPESASSLRTRLIAEADTPGQPSTRTGFDSETQRRQYSSFSRFIVTQVPAAMEQRGLRTPPVGTGLAIPVLGHVPDLTKELPADVLQALLLLQSGRSPTSIPVGRGGLGLFSKDDLQAAERPVVPPRKSTAGMVSSSLHFNTVGGLNTLHHLQPQHPHQHQHQHLHQHQHQHQQQQYSGRGSVCDRAGRAEAVHHASELLLSGVFTLPHHSHSAFTVYKGTSVAPTYPQLLKMAGAGFEWTDSQGDIVRPTDMWPRLVRSVNTGGLSCLRKDAGSTALSPVLQVLSLATYFASSDPPSLSAWLTNTEGRLTRPVPVEYDIHAAGNSNSVHGATACSAGASLLFISHILSLSQQMSPSVFEEKTAQSSESTTSNSSSRSSSSSSSSSSAIPLGHALELVQAAFGLSDGQRHPPTDLLRILCTRAHVERSVWGRDTDFSRAVRRLLQLAGVTLHEKLAATSKQQQEQQKKQANGGDNAAGVATTRAWALSDHGLSGGTTDTDSSSIDNKGVLKTARPPNSEPPSSRGGGGGGRGRGVVSVGTLQEDLLQASTLAEHPLSNGRVKDPYPCAQEAVARGILAELDVSHAASTDAKAESAAVADADADETAETTDLARAMLGLQARRAALHGSNALLGLGGLLLPAARGYGRSPIAGADGRYLTPGPAIKCFGDEYGEQYEFDSREFSALEARGEVDFTTATTPISGSSNNSSNNGRKELGEEESGKSWPLLVVADAAVYAAECSRMYGQSVSVYDPNRPKPAARTDTWFRSYRGGSRGSVEEKDKGHYTGVVKPSAQHQEEEEEEQEEQEEQEDKVDEDVNLGNLTLYEAQERRRATNQNRKSKKKKTKTKKSDTSASSASAAASTVRCSQKKDAASKQLHPPNEHQYGGDEPVPSVPVLQPVPPAPTALSSSSPHMAPVPPTEVVLGQLVQNESEFIRCAQVDRYAVALALLPFHLQQRDRLLRMIWLNELWRSGDGHVCGGVMPLPQFQATVMHLLRAAHPSHDDEALSELVRFTWINCVHRRDLIKGVSGLVEDDNGGGGVLDFETFCHAVDVLLK